MTSPNNPTQKQFIEDKKGLVLDYICEIPPLNEEANRYARYMMEEYKGHLESDPFDQNDGSPLSQFYWEMYAHRSRELLLAAITGL